MDEKGPLSRNTTTAPNNQPNGKYDYYYDYDPAPSYHETYRDYDYHAKSPINLHMQPTTPHDYLPSENDHDLQLVGGGGVGRGRRDGPGGRGGTGGAVGGGGSGGGGRIDNGRRMNEEMRELTQQDGRAGREGAGGEDGRESGGEREVLEGPKRWFSLVILLLVLLVVIFVVVAIVILYLNCKYLPFHLMYHY